MTESPSRIRTTTCEELAGRDAVHVWGMWKTPPLELSEERVEFRVCLLCGQREERQVS